MFEEKKFISQKHIGDYLDYFEYIPKYADKIPLIVYIHGAGSRGNNLSCFSHVGPIGEIEKGREIPAAVVAPQCHCETWFDSFSVLTEFIETMIMQSFVDKSRVYIMGISMGAYCSWQMCISHPDWFAAAVPVCGGGMYWDAARIKDLPIWSFHGALDNVVLPEESIHMVAAINRSGGNAQLTIVPKAEHNSWDYAFSQDKLWKWLFEQERK